jgi:hypothetical protein
MCLPSLRGIFKQPTERRAAWHGQPGPHAVGDHAFSGHDPRSEHCGWQHQTAQPGPAKVQESKVDSKVDSFNNSIINNNLRPADF